MLKYKLQPLINQVSSATGIPLHLVESAISHEFKTISNFVMDPQPTHVGFMLEDLGKFYFKHSTLRTSIKASIEHLRRGTRLPSATKGLRTLLNMRHIVFEAHMRKKYKKRFGAWH